MGQFSHIRPAAAFLAASVLPASAALYEVEATGHFNDIVGSPNALSTLQEFGIQNGSPVTIKYTADYGSSFGSNTVRSVSDISFSLENQNSLTSSTASTKSYTTWVQSTLQDNGETTVTYNDIGIARHYNSIPSLDGLTFSSEGNFDEVIVSGVYWLQENNYGSGTLNLNGIAPEGYTAYDFSTGRSVGSNNFDGFLTFAFFNSQNIPRDVGSASARLNIDSVTVTPGAIPEHSTTAALAGLGALGVAAARRRRPESFDI